MQHRHHIQIYTHVCVHKTRAKRQNKTKIARIKIIDILIFKSSLQSAISCYRDIYYMYVCFLRFFFSSFLQFLRGCCFTAINFWIDVNRSTHATVHTIGKQNRLHRSWVVLIYILTSVRRLI